MMKKIYLMTIITVLLLCSCSPKVSVQNNNEDDGNWNLEANYSIIQNTASSIKTMEITEDSILVFPSTVMNEYGVSSYLTGYIDHDEITLFPKNVSSTCSIYDHSGCQGVFSADEMPLNYYKGKLYYIINEYIIDTNTDNFYLMRCDIDGSHQEKLYQFDMTGINIYVGSYSVSFIQFHNNNIYIQHFGKLYYGNIDSLDIVSMNLTGVKDVSHMFIYNDIMYMSAEEYNDGNQIHFNVTLECDLEGNIKKLLYENKILSFIDDKNMFYFNENKEWCVLNRKTNKSQKLLDSGIFIFKYQDKYLLDTWDFSETPKILILNEEGKVLLEKDYSAEDMHISQLYTGDRLYVSKDDWFGYYEISDEGISDLIMFPKSE